MRRSLGLALILAAMLAACGSGGSSPAASSGASHAPTQAAAPTAATASVPTQAAAESSAASVAPTVAPTQAGDAGGECGPGTYLTFDTQTFCGPAKATVKLGAETYELTQGECEGDSTVGFLVNLGTLVIRGKDLPKDAPLYFAVAIKGGDSATVTGMLGGTAIAIPSATANLAADGQSGTVSGTAVGGAALEASFTCK